MNAGILAGRLAKAQEGLSEAVEKLRARFELPDRQAADRPPTRDVQVRRLFEIEDLSEELCLMADAPVRAGQEAGKPRAAAVAEEAHPEDLVDPVAGAEVVYLGYPDNPGAPVLKNTMNIDVHGRVVGDDPEVAAVNTAEAGKVSNEEAARLDEERRNAKQPDAKPLGFHDNPGAPVQQYVGQERDGRLNFDVHGNPVVLDDHAAFEATNEAAKRLDEADKVRDEERKEATLKQLSEEEKLSDEERFRSGFPDNPGAPVLGRDPARATREVQEHDDAERARIAQETQAEVSKQSLELGKKLRAKLLAQVEGEDKAEPEDPEEGVERRREEREEHERKLEELNTPDDDERDELVEDAKVGDHPPVEPTAAGDVAQHVADEKDEGHDDLDQLPLNNRQKAALREAGVYSLSDIQGRSDEELLKVEGIGPAKLDQLRQRAPHR